MKLPQRKSIRLPQWDYSEEGYYFVTICTQNRECLFGHVGVVRDQPEMILNDVGKIIKNIWESLPQYYPVELDIFQTMPNHMHAIVQIVGATLVVARTGIKPRAGTRPAPTLGNITGTFKSLTTHEYINGVNNKGWKKFDKRLWQRNYYEHIIRNEKELNQIREYVLTNPARWQYDRNNPVNIKH